MSQLESGNFRNTPALPQLLAKPIFCAAPCVAFPTLKKKKQRQGEKDSRIFPHQQSKHTENIKKKINKIFIPLLSSFYTMNKTRTKTKNTFNVMTQIPSGRSNLSLRIIGNHRLPFTIPVTSRIKTTPMRCIVI